MGDLDDFFAKKDKKGKGKTKIVAANLYDEKKKEGEAKKERLKKKHELENNEQTPDVLKKTKDDDDWEDFDDPSDLNLEGLKVVNLADGRADERSGGTGGDGGGGADEEGAGGRGGGPADTRPFESVRESGSRSGRSHMAHAQPARAGEAGGGGARPEAVSMSNRWAALGEDNAS